MYNTITSFLDFIEETKKLSPATITNYGFYLRRFADYLEEEHHVTSPKKITDELVKKYQLYLSKYTDHNDDKLKKSTQNYHLIALRNFFKFLSTRGFKNLDPKKIKLTKLPDHAVEYLFGVDLQRILEAPLTEGEPMIRLRDKAMLELFFSTGLKVSELAQLRIDQINLQKNKFSAGKNTRLVDLSTTAKLHLKKYLDARHDDNPYIFIAFDRAGLGADSHLTPRSIERLVGKYALRAGITKQVTPQSLRHSYAKNLISQGEDLEDLQTALGHSTLANTQIYSKKKK